jgi:thiamine biosynthesis lipoprotein
LIAVAALLAAALSAAATRPAGLATPGELRLDGRTQGTTYRVRGFAPGPISAERAQELADRVEALLARIDTLMSSWREDSEVERFNRLPAGAPFTFSPENAALLARSRDIWTLTRGAFDPTVGSSVRLWGFGGAPKRHDVPDPAEVRAAREEGGFENLVLDGPTARKRRDGLRVDLSGIAQGYTVDQVFALLTAEGFRSLLVEVGGEVRAGAPPPGEKAWCVAIDSPAGGSLGPVLALEDASVSTSGDYESGFVVDGVRYSHILDPRDGRPVRSGVASATVVAPDCATADALATALVVLGPREALALVESRSELACRLLVRPADGGPGLTERTSSRFPLRLWEPPTRARAGGRRSTTCGEPPSRRSSRR